MSGLIAEPPPGVQFVGPREEKPAIGQLGLLPSTAATAKFRYSSVARSAGRRKPDEPSLPAEKMTTIPAASQASTKLQNVVSQSG